MPKPYRLQDCQQRCADRGSVVSQDFTLQAGGNLNLISTSRDIHVVQGNLSAGNRVSVFIHGRVLPR